MDFMNKRRSHKLLFSKNIYSTFYVFAWFLCEIIPDMHFNSICKYNVGPDDQVMEIFHSAGACPGCILSYSQSNVAKDLPQSN